MAGVVVQESFVSFSRIRKISKGDNLLLQRGHAARSLTRIIFILTSLIAKHGGFKNQLQQLMFNSVFGELYIM